MPQLLQAGINVTAIGMGVVFVLLTSLVYIIRGMSVLSHAIEGALQATPDPASDDAESQPPQEIVSAITAAITTHRNRN